MAKQLNPESAVDQHSVANRATVIRDAANAMADIRAKRKELNEHAAEVRKRVKDMNIRTEAFDAAVRALETEQQQRDAYWDSMHECFNALGIGDQLDWEKVQQRLDDPATTTDDLPKTNGAGSKKKPNG